MPLFINTNLASINAQRQLSQSTLGISKSMEKLSSGLRINRASDDVGGLGVAEVLRSQTRSYAVASRNANDGISLIGVAEGSLQIIGDSLVRMRELAEQWPAYFPANRVCSPAGRDRSDCGDNAVQRDQCDQLDCGDRRLPGGGGRYR